MPSDFLHKGGNKMAKPRAEEVSDEERKKMLGPEGTSPPREAAEDVDMRQRYNDFVARKLQEEGPNAEIPTFEEFKKQEKARQLERDEQEDGGILDTLFGG